jgi:hypothetical protein
LESIERRTAVTKHERLFRGLNVILAVAVVMFAATCAARALTSVKAANAAILFYNLGSGGSTTPFTPPNNQSVFLMGVCNTSGVRGTGHVALLRIAGSFIEWTGLNSPSAASITEGFSGSTGTDIVQLDFNGGAKVRVAGPDQLEIHNYSTGTRDGNVTLLW